MPKKPVPRPDTFIRACRDSPSRFMGIMPPVLMDSLRRHSLAVGVAAMVLLVVGTSVEGGSLLQKIIFLTGAPMLGLAAHLNGQKMFAVLQVVVTIGAALAFFDWLSPVLKYAVMLGSGLTGVGHLLKTNYSREDKWWPLGGLGLLGIATGFATNPAASPLLFNLLLGVGGLLVALYSAIGFFRLKVRIAAIWLVLNVIFSITPLSFVFSRIF